MLVSAKHSRSGSSFTGILLSGLTLVASGCATTPSLSEPDWGAVTMPRPAEAGSGTQISAGRLDVLAFSCSSGDSDLTLCSPLRASQASKLREALTATSDVVFGLNFQALVREDDLWFAAVGNNLPLRGSQLLQTYPSRIPPFVVIVLDRSAANERAHANYFPPVIAISQSVLDDWDSAERKSSLINTLAHEAAHLIGQRVATGTEFAFLDQGFSFYPCKQANLVSYKIGNMAECVHRGLSGDEFSTCMIELHHAMAIPWYTLPWSWWRAFCPAYLPPSDGVSNR